MAESSDDKNLSALDPVKAHRLHAIKAADALDRIVKTLDEGGRYDRETIRLLVNHIHRLDQDYRKLALYLASEEEFPDRATRWPGFFGSGEIRTDESEDTPEGGG